MEIRQIPDGHKFDSEGFFSHCVFFASHNSQLIRPPRPLAREKTVKRIVVRRGRLLIFDCSAGRCVMDGKLRHGQQAS
ncbi:hypothetical protein [Bosea sp. NBC_00550]|jgi:hypothetical protein|uniref:hypothetical protein n=1 Tax=Bosea sp. NBC_00550 TaxID=2969621 RepID=UPI0022328F61|nr:hypothetical protein [Bosea sp. NBC_00550]UZF95823.1 hypothetical protein NWE53_28020 [Bosea sp. NBC_00550]